VAKVDHLIVGGAMATTFLFAQGNDVGASLCEREMADTARDILKAAAKTNCQIHLPVDAVVANQFKPHAPSVVCAINAIPSTGMILDIGPRSLMNIANVIDASKTLVWNGPVGAFETAPFDGSTVQIARMVAAASRAGETAQRGGRWRHGGRARACGVECGTQLSFDRRRRLPRMAGGQGAARYCRADDTRCTSSTGLARLV
jgi:phosphoglycerate kinase